MNRLGVDRIPLYICVSGALASALVYALADAWVAFSAVVGAVIALVNFYIYRWIAGRVTGGSIRRQAALSLLLVAKILALIALITLIVMQHWVDPIGLLVGLSALVVGLLSASVRYISAGQSTSSER